MSAIQDYRFAVGDIRCIAIGDGTELCSIENIVKNVPLEAAREAFAERGYPPADGLTYYFNCLYLETVQHHVLIDAGWGQDTQRLNGTLLDRLLANAVAPADVDTIVITHGDVDHIGGIVSSTGELTYPNAEYVLLREAWDFWSNAAVIARWPEALTVFGRQTLPLIRERVKVIDAGVEFRPGLTLISAPGHRPGDTMVSVESSGERLYHLADAVGHPILAEHPAWVWPYDFAPAQAEAGKRQILGQAAEQGALVFGSHLIFPGVGRVTQQDEGWRWEPLG